MIVISGALVLVALVLLIIGVVGPDLSFVYASIAVSLVSLVFLVVGILQRRGETAPASDSAGAAPQPQVQPADAAGVTAVIPSQEARASMRPASQEPPVAETADEELETGGTVLVVEGRPRYHVDGCRYLSGKSAEAIDVLDAREEGFSPCGVCKPDDALAAAAEAEPVDEQLAEEPPTEELVIEEETVVEEDVPGVDVAPTPATSRRASSRKAPAKKAPARKAPAKAASATKAVGATKAVKAPAAKAPARAAKTAPAAVKAPSTAAAAGAPARAGSVVVIPDRGKFHKAQCRFVRDADDVEVMSKSAASRAGYAACGVCKP